MVSGLGLGLGLARVRVRVRVRVGVEVRVRVRVRGHLGKLRRACRGDSRVTYMRLPLNKLRRAAGKLPMAILTLAALTYNVPPWSSAAHALLFEAATRAMRAATARL